METEPEPEPEVDPSIKKVRTTVQSACKESCVRQPGTSGFCYWVNEFCA